MGEKGQQEVCESQRHGGSGTAAHMAYVTERYIDGQQTPQLPPGLLGVVSFLHQFTAKQRNFTGEK